MWCGRVLLVEGGATQRVSWRVGGEALFGAREAELRRAGGADGGRQLRGKRDARERGGHRHRCLGGTESRDRKRVAGSTSKRHRRIGIVTRMAIGAAINIRQPDDGQGLPPSARAPPAAETHRD